LLKYVRFDFPAFTNNNSKNLVKKLEITLFNYSIVLICYIWWGGSRVPVPVTVISPCVQPVPELTAQTHIFTFFLPSLMSILSHKKIKTEKNKYFSIKNIKQDSSATRHRRQHFLLQFLFTKYFV